MIDMLKSVLRRILYFTLVTWIKCSKLNVLFQLNGLEFDLNFLHVEEKEAKKVTLDIINLM